MRIKVWIEDDHSIGSLLKVSYCKCVINEEKATHIEIDSNTLFEMWLKMIVILKKSRHTPARVLSKNMKESEPGLLNSSTAFCRTEPLVLPS